MKKLIYLLAAALVCGSVQCCAGVQQKSSFSQLSRQCIKIWCLMRNLVDDADVDKTPILEEQDLLTVDYLDNLLCRVVRVRDMIAGIDCAASNKQGDEETTAAYVDSSLDCIGQYTHDLVKQYPGSWSTIIQEQVFRAQEAYADTLMRAFTN